MKSTGIPLLTPYKMGQFDLSHRVVLAPLTRQRSYGGVPQPHAAVYYGQRATPGGFLISEGTRVSAGIPVPAARQEQETSSSFVDVPGIWAPEQVDAWRPVVEAVHAKGGVFFCQLWHVAGDAVRQRQQVSPQMSYDGRREELSSPRRVAEDDAPRVVEGFRRAARNAMDAGFDGVEILGANGYFVDNDDGGRSANGHESRCRFALEVVDAVAREVGGHRVGVRLDQFAGATADEHALALHVVSRLNDRGVLYCHMIEPRGVDGRRRASRRLLPFREAFGGTFIASGGYGREEGDAAVGEGYADLVAYGRLFLANPDLPRRFQLGAPLNECDAATFYGAAAAADPAVGYTDYPFFDSRVDISRGVERSAIPAFVEGVRALFLLIRSQAPTHVITRPLHPRPRFPHTLPPTATRSPPPLLLRLRRRQGGHSPRSLHRRRLLPSGRKERRVGRGAIEALSARNSPPNSQSEPANRARPPTPRQGRKDKGKYSVCALRSETADFLEN